MYNEDNARGLTTLSRIEYGGHTNGEQPFATVEFDYTTNTKGFGGFYYGTPVINNKRLTQIKSKVDGRTYREYRLGYETSNFMDHRTLLTSIEECAPLSATNATMQCKPKTQFTWERPPLYQTNYSTFSHAPNFLSGVSSSEVRVFDIDGDGKDDLIYELSGYWRVRLASSPDITRNLTHLGVGNGKKQYALVIDANADGVKDLLVAQGENQSWNRISYADGRLSVVPVNHTVKSIGFAGQTQVADVNGDGREDIIFRQGSSINAYLQPIHGQSWSTRTLYTFSSGLLFGEFDGGLGRQTASMKSSSAMDINGDGRSDLIIKITTDNGYCNTNRWYPFGADQNGVPRPIPDVDKFDQDAPQFEDLEAQFRPPEHMLSNDMAFTQGINERDCRDLGGTWVSNRVTAHEVLVSSGTLAYPVLEQRGQIGNGSLKSIRAADFNGDGLTDVAYVVGTTWYYRLSTGASFLPARAMGLSANDNFNHRTQFVDLNRDGRADVLHATSATWLNTYYSRPNMQTSTSLSFEHRGYTNLSSNSQVVFGDVDGDGKFELLKQNGSTWVTHKQRPALADFTIRVITNGFGVRTFVDYLPMTDPQVYVEKPRHDSLDPSTISPRNAGSLVHRVRSDVGPNAQVSVTYQYGGLRLNTQGRGHLGFEMLRTIDDQTGVKTETRYHQDVTGNKYANVGMPLSTVQKRGNVLISSSMNTLEVKTTSNNSKFPYIRTSSERSFWVDNDAVSSSLASITTTNMHYDTFGNVTNSTVSQTGYSVAGIHTLATNTVNEYPINTELKRLGRLKSTTVTKTRNGRSTTRKSGFTYRTDNMLDSTIVYGDSVTSNYNGGGQYVGTHLKTVFDYDIYGNKARVCKTANTGYHLPSNNTIPLNNASVRCSQTKYYGNKGRYVEYAINSKGEKSSFVYYTSSSNQRGLIASVIQKDDNGTATHTFYDGFGSATFVDYPDANSRSITRGKSVSYGGHFYERVTRSQAPVVVIYYDRWGREVAKSQQYRTSGSATSWLTVRTTYDTQGRVSTVSQPNSSAVTRSEYDILGRAEQITHPNNASEYVTYMGSQVITTNAKGQQRTEVKNGLGETARSIDNHGNTINFGYNEYGQLLTASTAYGNATQLITTKYDSWGRKISTSDPNKGTWTYKYNAFGELIEQTDGKMQKYTFRYDALGRMIGRHNIDEGSTCWGYGSVGQRGFGAHGYRGSGKLLWVGLYSQSGINCSGTASKPSGTVKELRTFTFDYIGRPKKQKTQVKNSVFESTQVYNSYSQVVTQVLPNGQSNMSVTNDYDSLGAVQSIINNHTGVTIWRAEEYTSQGQLKEAKLGNGIEVRYDFDVSGHNTFAGSYYGNTRYYSAAVDIDDIGNVERRISHYRNLNGSYQHFTEEYDYDLLNRLEERTLTLHAGTTLPSSFSQLQEFDYDESGNIKSKSGMGNYHYHGNIANRLERIVAANGAETHKFSYDVNGNVISDKQRTFKYTAFDKPYEIKKGSNTITMAYGIDRQMLTKTHDRYEGNTRVITNHTYVGNYEKIVKTTNNGVTEHKYTLAGGMVVYTQRSNNSIDTHYLHKDTQGSISMVTNQSRQIVSQSLYDPFGSQLQLFQNSALNNITYQAPTEAGYTGHQQMNSVGIIHMNGRIYDPTLGRFLQADPFIQAPMNTQNYNRYSYVINNPMRYTDPSGYNFFEKLARPFKNAVRSVFRAIGPQASSLLVEVGSLFCGPYYAACKAVGAYDIARAFGASSTGALKAGAIAGAFALIKQEAEVRWGEGSWQASLAEELGDNQQERRLNNIVQQTTGATVSNVTGNKFANGAGTRSFFDNFGRHLPSLPQGVVDFSAGFGDSLSFGLTDWIRDNIGINSVVNQDSNDYSNGEWSAIGVSLSFGGLHLGRNAIYQTGKAGNLGLGVNRLFYDPRKWGTVRSMWSTTAGGGQPWLKANNQHLHHWLIPQRFSQVNAGFNYMPISSGFNSWMNGSTSYRLGVEWGFKGTVVGVYGVTPTVAIRD